ncbi:MAG: NAD-dependent epimerase/dehydratase family protein [Chthoniobacterales bacterium]|nr:NAD-dependent epimerase/dehydratase family protein [Chthoniobacterales bacterium]
MKSPVFSKSKASIIIVGCGFLGKATAQLFSEQGYRVTSIVRSESSREELLKEHLLFDIVLCDVTNKEAVKKIAPQLQEASLMIYAVSSGRGDAETYAAVYRDGLKNVLATWQPAHLIFVSSTSVYAQTEGEVVTESSEAKPDRATSRVLLEAEAVALAAGGSAARFAGIYGPGRSILLKKFLHNEARLEEGGHRWINQIHRDDGARALYHLGTSSTPAGIYNVADDTPATQRDVYQWMSDYLQQPLPPNGPADLNRKRGWTSKRVSNKKLRDTGWSPQFPSYQEALPQLFLR